MNAFKRWITSYLKSIILHLDNGWKFRNKVMENYLKENNIDLIKGGPYYPQIKKPLKRLIKLFKIFMISAKDHQGKMFV